MPEACSTRRWRQFALPSPVVLAELRPPEPVGVDATVLLPQKRQRHTGSAPQCFAAVDNDMNLANGLLAEAMPALVLRSFRQHYNAVFYDVAVA